MQGCGSVTGLFSFKRSNLVKGFQVVNVFTVFGKLLPVYALIQVRFILQELLGRLNSVPLLPFPAKQLIDRIF